jgi:hypothetical protein
VNSGRPGSERLAELLRDGAITARPRPDCPSADQIWAALNLEVPVEERERIIDHTIECPSCAEAWRLAMEIRRQDATVISAPPAGRAHSTAWLRAAAAVLVVGVGTGLVLRWRGPSEEPPVRDQPTNAISSLLPEQATLPRQDFILRWSGGPDGARYDLVVSTVNLEVIADVRGLERSEYRLAPERLASLAAGTRLLWRVVAHMPDGSTLSSATAAVSVQ